MIQLQAPAIGFRTAIQREGDPLIAKNDERLAPRLKEKIAEPDENGCWMWLAYLEFGYGQVSWKNKKTWAHRLVYELLVGSIPVDPQRGRKFDLDHLCHGADPSCVGGDTCPHRACVNPAHLEIVTNAVNVLRGNGPSAKHAQKTHCPRGHSYDVLNTRINRNGSRSCRACIRMRYREAVEAEGRVPKTWKTRSNPSGA